MDFDQIKTFLKVIEAGSFIAAGGKLGVTQSTISARIKELESDLGHQLFVRHKSGVTLTAAGRRFQTHAQTLIRVLRQAHDDVALPPDVRTVVSFGGQHGSWSNLLQDWTVDFRKSNPELGLRAVMATPDVLLQQLADGALDFLVMCSPHPRSGYTVEKLADENLALVSTRPDHPGVNEKDYVMIDWGPDFLDWHANQFPDFGTAVLNVNQGGLGARIFVEHGGAGYLPESLIADRNVKSRVHRVKGAPVFRRAVHVIYSPEFLDPAVATALESLRQKAKNSPSSRD